MAVSRLKLQIKRIDIRVSVLPVAFGERIVMRLLDKSRTVLQDLKDLDLVSEIIKLLKQILEDQTVLFILRVQPVLVKQVPLFYFK